MGKTVKEIKEIKIDMTLQEAINVIKSGVTDPDTLASAYAVVKVQRDILSETMDTIEPFITDVAGYKKYFGNSEPIKVVNGSASVTLTPSKTKTFVVDEDKLIAGALPAGIVTVRTIFNKTALKKQYVGGSIVGGIKEACSFDEKEVVKISFKK